MKRMFRFIDVTGLLEWGRCELVPRTCEGAPAAGDVAKSASPAVSAPSLRKPGFVFMELGTTHYLSYFESVADFKLTYRKPGYLVAQSAFAELSFIDPKFWSNGHPFAGKLTGSGQGLGIEIGVVVGDLDKAYAAAVKWEKQGWPISTGIVRRPWGVRDFRVLAPEGYYSGLRRGVEGGGCRAALRRKRQEGA